MVASNLNIVTGRHSTGREETVRWQYRIFWMVSGVMDMSAISVDARPSISTFP